MTFNNRTYYGDAIDVNITVGIAAGTYTLRGNSTNASFFGFKFSITPWQYGFGESVLNTTIVEPGGSVFHGGPYWTGEAGVFSNSWFTPDNKSGVYAVPGAETETPSYPIATVVLLVEPGIWGI